MPDTTCPDCGGTGTVTKPYIAGVVSVMHPCACRNPVAAALSEAAARRAAEMNAELPEDQRAMLTMKGMIE